MLDITDRLYEYFSKGDWNNARRLLLKQLRKYPNDSSSITRLSYIYLNEGEYSKALEMSHKAYSINPHDPVVLWDYANALFRNDRFAESIRLFKILMNMSINTLSARGYNKNWSNGIQNDCRFWIACGYMHLDKIDLAAKYFRLHLANRRRGRPTECSIREAKNFLKSIDSIREKIKNNELRLWISLIETKPINKQKERNFKGAFTHGFVMAHSVREVKNKLHKALENKGYKAIAFEDTEEFDKLCLKHEVDKDLRRIAAKAIRSRTAKFGMFYSWKK